MDDEFGSNSYVSPEILKFAELIGKEDPIRATNFKIGVKKREQINNAAIKMIDEKTPQLCASLCAIYAQEHEELILAIEMGWAVARFEGIADIFNNISKMCVDRGDIETALMYRVFAIAIKQVGIEKFSSDEFDSILERAYNLDLKLPTEELWDQANARMILEETEVEAFCKLLKENEIDE